MALHNCTLKIRKNKTLIKKTASKEQSLLLIMKTAVALVIFILGTCFYMSTAAPQFPQLTDAYNEIAMAADNPDPCLLCKIYVDHIICEDLLMY